MPQKHLLATVWSENIWKHSNVTPRNVAHFLLQRHGISWNLKKSSVELGEIFCRKKGGPGYNGHYPGGPGLASTILQIIGASYLIM